jgi:hypothetical protein
LERTRPSLSSTAAAVSSHDDSIPKTGLGFHGDRVDWFIIVLLPQ